MENFEDTCINTAIDTISATIASTSKNGNSDGMTAYRAPSSARGKGTLMPAATFDRSCHFIDLEKMILNIYIFVGGLIKYFILLSILYYTYTKKIRKLVRIYIIQTNINKSI